MARALLIHKYWYLLKCAPFKGVRCRQDSLDPTRSFDGMLGMTQRMWCAVLQLTMAARIVLSEPQPKRKSLRALAVGGS